MIFLKELIIILRRKRSCVKGRYKSEKVDDFFISQNIGLVYK